MKIISQQEIKQLGITAKQCCDWIRESFSIKQAAQLPAKISCHPADMDFFTSMPCLLPEDAEGNRFFDLVRWGIAADYLNNYIAKEKEVVDYLRAAKFTENRDEYLPIPLNQINYSSDSYQQNVGW